MGAWDQAVYPAVEYARASLARKLIRRRPKARLTQAELARRAGIRAETLNRIEKGKTTPDVATIALLQRALDHAEASGCLVLAREETGGGDRKHGRRSDS
jgi:transcriptional regulator with XRE-family HTH domain